MSLSVHQILRSGERKLSCSTTVGPVEVTFHRPATRREPFQCQTRSFRPLAVQTVSPG